MGQKNRPTSNQNLPRDKSEVSTESWDEGRIQFERDDADTDLDTESPAANNYKATDVRKPAQAVPSQKSH
ncbi:MAG: hypothetical protein ABIR96_09845 [Bdellovibrionota bacterium]